MPRFCKRKTEYYLRFVRLEKRGLLIAEKTEKEGKKGRGNVVLRETY